MAIEADKSATSDNSVIDPFEKFASENFYCELNRQFVEKVGFESGDAVIDLACGPGNIAEIFIPKIGPDGFVIEVDPYDKAIEASKRRLGGLSVNIAYIQGGAEDLDKLLNHMQGAVDKVICGNAVHNFADKGKAFKNIYDLLTDNGVFAFNTGFYQGSVAEEESKFLKRWINRSFRIAVSELGFQRTKGREENVAAAPENEISPEGYGSLLINAGFKNASMETHEEPIPMSAMYSISEDREWLAGAMSKLPSRIATEALQRGLQPFIQEGKTSTPRGWLTVIARKNSFPSNLFV